MPKTAALPDDPPELAQFRDEIDRIDEQLAALLKTRTEIVSKVGALKRQTAPDIHPIRAGREAEQIRRISGMFTGGSFSPHAAAVLWRNIIAASLAVESSLSLSVYATDASQELYWLSREQFGAFTPITKQPSVKRVIGDVLDGKASVGVAPGLRGETGSAPWWLDLIQSQENALSLFAFVPTIVVGSARSESAGFAFGKVRPEPSGDDLSYVVAEVRDNVSQHTMQTALAAEKLDATWIAVHPQKQGTRHHLLEIKGFVTEEHEAMQRCLQALGRAVVQTSYLGVCAVPLKVGVKIGDAKKAPQPKPAA